MENRLDFVAIGDITTDAFIQLKDVVVERPDEHNKHNLMVCMRFGDKIEYEDVVVVPAVGNSPNAAVSARRLGLKSALVTNLGNDAFGLEDIEVLKKEGVNTDYVRVHEGQKSNYHYVLTYEAERTILVKHHAYDYQMPAIEPPPKWIYLSSLGESSLPFQHDIAEYLKKHQETSLAFQPGTFQIKCGYEALKDIYQETDLFFCNKEEAMRILNTKESEIKFLLHGINTLGPKIVVITDGPNGAYVYDGKDTVWFIPMYPDPKPPINRTGAGDAFSSTFTSVLALGFDIPTALSWGPINSMNVVQHIGAQKGLLSREQLETYLTNKPSSYVPKKI